MPTKCSKCGQDNPPEALFCATCGASLAVPMVPGVRSSYRHAWRQLWKHFSVLLVTGIIYLAISGGSYLLSLLPTQVPLTAAPFLPKLLSLAYSFLFSYPVGYGVAFAYLKAARGDHVEVKDMFEVFHNYRSAVLSATPLLLIQVTSSTNLLGILDIMALPGVFLMLAAVAWFAWKLAFTPFLVVDSKMGPVEAWKTSMRMTSGHGGEIFLIVLLSIPILLAGLIALGVGVLVAIMWVSLAFASLYHAVNTSRGASPQPVPPAQQGPMHLQ